MRSLRTSKLLTNNTIKANVALSVEKKIIRRPINISRAIRLQNLLLPKKQKLLIDNKIRKLSLPFTSDESENTGFNYKFLAIMTALSGVVCHSLTESETSTKVVPKGSSYEIIDDEANLLEYPIDRSYPLHKDCQITIGDLHGNALKLIYFLIRHNVLDMKREDYQEIVDIYQKESDELTATDISRFNTVLERTKLNTIPTGALLRIIGDELADRGSNDYFTLKVFEKLTKNNIPFEILFSNHGYEFIKVFEQGILTHQSYLEKHSGMAISLSNLRLLIEKQLISMDEVNQLVKQHYLPHLKLLGYSLQKQSSPWDIITSVMNLTQASPDNITLYSHAPIGINTVKAIAFNENIHYSDQTVSDLANTIEQINRNFSAIVIHNEVLKTLGTELQQKEDVRDISLAFPILRAIWSRGHQEKDLPLKTINKFNLFYVHGHDGGGEVDPRFVDHITNLDNKFGKGSEKENAKYSVAYTIEKRYRI